MYESLRPDRPGLRNVEQVEKVQNRITQSLQAMMASNHSEDPALFAKLLMKIPDLRTLNTLHSEKLLGKYIETRFQIVKRYKKVLVVD